MDLYFWVVDCSTTVYGEEVKSASRCTLYLNRWCIYLGMGIQREYSILEERIMVDVPI